MKRLIILCLLISVLCPLTKADYINKPLMGSQIDRSHSLSRSLVGCWFADGSNSAFDYTRNGNNGTFYGDTHNIPAKGYAWSFDGTGDYIEITDADVFSPVLTPFSISIWVFIPDATTCYIVSKGRIGTDIEWLLSTDGNKKLIFRLFDNSEGEVYIGRRYFANTMPENQWIHIVVVCRGGTTSTSIELYLYGIRVDDNNYNLGSFVSVENLGHPVWIARYSGAYSVFNADDVKIYDRALLEGEIRQLYREPWCMFEDE